MLTLFWIAFMFVAATLEGYVLSVMWGWFIVPVFKAPGLSVPYAIGFALVVAMLTHKTRKAEDDPELGYVAVMGLTLPLLFLGCGWIVKLFV